MMAETLGITNAVRNSITLSVPPEATPKTSHVYADVDKLEGTDKVGSKQCVALVKYYLGDAPASGGWSEGEQVVGNATIVKGTAIATFVNGKYESKKTGNHAAFYMNQDDNGITIMDQWVDDAVKPKVSSRHIKRKGKSANGSLVNPSNNADAFSIILW
jgi:hypothetical protein